MQIGKDMNKIHKTLFMKLQLDKDVERDEKIAKELTQFLMAVKRYLYTNKNFYSENSNAYNNAIVLKQYLHNETAKQFAEEMLNTIENNSGEKVGRLLFQAEGQEHTFERAFSYMQSLAYKALTDTDIDAEIFRGGQTRVGIGGKTNASGNTFVDLTKIPDEIAKMSLQQLQKYFGSNFRNKDQAFIYFNQVDQKIDNKALTLDIHYQAGLSTYAKHIYNLLLSKNFSLKNYYKAGRNGLESETLEIGQTTFFRSIMSALQYSGLTYEEALKYFYRGMSAIEYHHDLDTIHHFNHLKHIYEFTGAGQKVYIGDGEWVDLKKVDFIVYNDPSSTLIQVISVKKALKEALEKIKDSDTLIKNVNYVVRRKDAETYWKR